MKEGYSLKIGFIGTGNMGEILIESFMDGKAVPPSSITIMNRTKIKAKKIQEKYREISIVNHANEVAKKADIIFICVKPHDVFGVAQELIPFLNKDKCVISITSPISVEQLEQVLPCSVVRAIPSITNRALAGVTLLTFGISCNEDWQGKITELFKTISTPVEIEEKLTRVSSDIVSCGPAFFSHLTQRFIEGAVKETEIDSEIATKLASEMLIGMGELLKKGYYTLPTLQEKVCVKGGITGEGIKVLESSLGDVFEQLFQATNSKFKEDINSLKKQYTINNSSLN